MKNKKLLLIILFVIAIVLAVFWFVPTKLVYSQNTESKAVKETRYWGPIAYASSIVFRPQKLLKKDSINWEQGISHSFGPFTSGSTFMVAFRDEVYKIRLVETPASSEGQLQVEYSDGINGWTGADSSNGIILIKGIQIPWSWHRKNYVFIYSDRYWEKTSSDCYSLRFADVSQSDLITTEEKNMVLQGISWVEGKRSSLPQ
jgi:hypothetical protein